MTHIDRPGHCTEWENGKPEGTNGGRRSSFRLFLSPMPEWRLQSTRKQNFVFLIAIKGTIQRGPLLTKKLRDLLFALHSQLEAVKKLHTIFVQIQSVAANHASCSSPSDPIAVHLSSILRVPCHGSSSSLRYRCQR